MRGNAPEALFAYQPDAVGDLVEILPSVGYALGQHQVAETIAAAEADGLESRAIAVAREFEFVGCEHLRPWAGVDSVAARDESFADLLREGAPLRISGFGIGLPRAGKQQRAGERAEGVRNQSL